MRVRATTWGLLIVFAIALSGCSSTRTVSTKRTATTTKTKRVPPGQAKKARGSKSARAYAPGRNKNKS